MPEVRAFMSSGYNPGNGKIYLVGGYSTGNISPAHDQTWEFDPAAGTYTNRATHPHGFGGAASGILNGHLYSAGGRDANNTTLNLTYDYDIAANTWTQRANMPAPEQRAGQRYLPGQAVGNRRRQSVHRKQPICLHGSVFCPGRTRPTRS